MLYRIIELSLRYRLLVLAAGFVLVLTGTHALIHLPLDAFPDTTPVQVQINTVAQALGPEEIEQQITLPIELAMTGLSGLEAVRSISKFGFSQVTVRFEDGVDIHLARQLVQHRLAEAELPAGLAHPKLAPLSSGLGEIYNYMLERPRPAGMTDEENLTELRTLQEWTVKPQLRTLSGVAEVNSWGGFQKQYHIEVDPTRLAKFDLAIEHVTEAIERNNSNVGGGVLEQAGEAQLVRGVGIVTTLEQIGDIVLASHDGVPVRVRDVADVKIGHEIRRGAVSTTELDPTADANTETATYQSHETVLGLGYMLPNQNSREVTQRFDEQVKQVQRTLPDGVSIRPVYRRTDLVDQVLRTVRNNLLEGALLVVAVLFAFLGNLRAGLIVASAIPLSMLFAGNLMLRCGITGSLMSLGAIDFGLIVDSSVVMVENCVRRLAGDKSDRSKLAIVHDAAMEVRRPTMFGELIIMIVYLPILTLEGVEGKLFRPMALTVIFAIAGSLVLSLTVIPALASLCLPRHITEKRPIFDRVAQSIFQPILHIGLNHPWITLSLTALATVATSVLALFLGAEFIPTLSEGSVEMTTVRLAGISLGESVRYGMRIEQILRNEFPDEIADLWTRTGAADIAEDPMGLEVSDVFIMFKTRDRWKRAKTQEELTRQIVAVMNELPGMRLFAGQPIQMRVEEMSEGIKGELGVIIYGDDLPALKAKAIEVESVLRKIRGASEILTEQITYQSMLETQVNDEAVARYGVARRDVLRWIEAAGGIHVGEVRDGQRRFPLVVRLAERYRDDVAALSTIVVPTASGQRIPLDRLLRFDRATSPSTISRERGSRRIVVQCNVRDRDVGSFVAEAQDKINPLIRYPFTVGWGGEYEQLERATRRLYVVVPTALISILALLYLSFGSLRDSLLVFSGVLFARIGGILGLWIRGMPFSISAGVGFVALAGAAILEGLILISTVRRFMAQGLGKREAIEQARLIRLRPVLMTGLVAAIGFVPMAFSTGVGSEVQRPLATVVVFGITTDTVLTMLVLPVLYLVFGRGPNEVQASIEQSEGAPPI